MIIITGASDNHFYSLINMINSFMRHNIKDILIVFNLGLNPSNWEFITPFNIIFINFSIAEQEFNAFMLLNDFIIKNNLSMTG